MEHPEKALFDEVLSLKKEIEESKERVIKLKKDYKEKIILLEKRSSIVERSENKFRKWKASSKETITLQLDEKEYTLLKSIFDDNVYKVSRAIFPENEKHIFIDTQKSFYKLFLHILIKGNTAYNKMKSIDGDKKISYTQIIKNFADSIDKYTRENTNFIKFLKEYFEIDSFMKIVSDFNLNCEILPKTDLLDLFVNSEIAVPYTNNNINIHVADSVKCLGDPNNTKAFFLGYNAKIDIELAEMIRVKRIYVKPFCSDIKTWSPSSGNSHTGIWVSRDGDNWEYVMNIPSNYGGNSENYLNEINLSHYVSFRYIRFNTNGSSYFSISYLSFSNSKKNEDIKSR